MAYITAWVNQPGRQSSPVTSLEKDFASGTRFVELLTHEGAMAPDAAAALTGQHPLEVFDAVCAAMDGLGAVYKPSSVGKAATGSRGGSAALLMAIKDAVEARAKGPPRPPGPRAIDTVRPAAEPFKRGAPTAWGADDFLEITYKENPNAFDPGRNAFAPVDMAVHLRKYHDAQRASERATSHRELAQQQAMAAAAAEKYAAIQEERQVRASVVRDHIDAGEADWRVNQEAQAERERSQLRFELALRERRAIKVQLNRAKLTSEAQSGAEEFERNMRRLGIGDGGGGGGAGEKLLSTGGESGLCFLRRIEAESAQGAMTREEAAELLESIKAKALGSRTARLERARRRRKTVVGQVAAQVRARLA